MTYTHSDQPWERPRQTRGKGSYSLYLLGEEIIVRTLGEALSTTLLKLEKPGFFDKLNKRSIEMGRRPFVARKREDLWPDRPDLTRYFAHQLGNSEWYYRALMSQPACESYLKIIASVAGIPTPRLVKRS
jgi:hypothetical protein